LMLDNADLCSETRFDLVRSVSLNIQGTSFFLSMIRHLPDFSLFPYTTLFRSRMFHPLLMRTRQLERESDLGVFVFVRSSNRVRRSEEHTSELQSLRHLVCRLLLEKKNECSRSRVSRSITRITIRCDLRIESES